MRLGICSRHLARYGEEGNNFLQLIVTAINQKQSGRA
jgi:hypothetical protein